MSVPTVPPAPSTRRNANSANWHKTWHKRNRRPAKPAMDSTQYWRVGYLIRPVPTPAPALAQWHAPTAKANKAAVPALHAPRITGTREHTAKHGGGGEAWISTSPPWLHRIAMPLLGQNTGGSMKSKPAVDYRAWLCVHALPKFAQSIASARSTDEGKRLRQICLNLFEQSIASAATDATMHAWDDDQHRQPH